MKFREPGCSEILKFPKTYVLRYWIRSRLTLSLPSGGGVYLTVYPSSRPNTDTVHNTQYTQHCTVHIRCYVYYTMQLTLKCTLGIECAVQCIPSWFTKQSGPLYISRTTRGAHSRGTTSPWPSPSTTSSTSSSTSCRGTTSSRPPRGRRAASGWFLIRYRLPRSSLPGPSAKCID